MRKEIERNIEKEIAIKNSNLKEVWISNRYVMVHAGAFCGDSTISSVIIPNSVNRICTNAFRQCKELTSVSLPDSQCYISCWAFGGCNKLESITLPRNLGGISENAFMYCKNLKSITILGSFLPVLIGCPNISSITIGENLKIFNPEAFLGCKHIKSIIIDENNSLYDSRNNCNAIVETKSDTLLLACNATKIPEGIRHIHKRAFIDCGRIRTLSLPSSLESIESLPKNVKKIIVPKGRKLEFKKMLPRSRGILLVEK